MYYRPSIKCVHTGYLILFSPWGPVCTVVPHILCTLYTIRCCLFRLMTRSCGRFRATQRQQTKNSVVIVNVQERNCCGTLYRQSRDRSITYNASQRPAIRSCLLISVPHPSCSQATSVFPYLILFRDCRNYANRQITVNYRKSKQQLI